MTPLKVKVKRLNNEAVIPKYAHVGEDVGMDITATSWEYDAEYDRIIYHTGLAFELPKGYGMFIFPRSSNCKTDSFLPNSVGILDVGYRGELLVIFKNRDKDSKMIPYRAGDRVAQIVILPYPEVEFEEVAELGESSRGDGGIGSTGS